MVQDAKHVAVNPCDQQAVSRWRESNRAVSLFIFIQTLKFRVFFYKMFIVVLVYV